MFEPRRRRASLGANPTERAAKSQDLNTALIFGPFHQGKGQYSTILWPKNDYFIKKETQITSFEGVCPVPFHAALWP
jgi:hypothetical protein